MVPLLYLAGHGSFFYSHTVGNSVLESGPVAVADARTAGAHLTSQLSILFALLTTVAIVVSRASLVVRACRDNWIFAALVIVALASTAWSENPLLTIQASVMIMLNTLFAFYLSRRFDVGRQMQLVLLLGWIAAALSVVLALGFPSVGIDQRQGVGAWQGVSVHKNSCAILMAYVLSPMLFSKPKTFASNALRIAYIVLCLLVAIETQSRTGWLVIAFLLCFVFLWKLVSSFARRDRPFLVFVIMSAAAGVLLVISLYLSILLFSIGKDPTLTGRTDLWRLVFLVAMKRPFLGYGYNAFWTGLQGESGNIALALGWNPTHAQNGFLDVWLQLGGVGLTLILLTLFRAFKDAFVCIRSKCPDSAGWYLSIVVITLICNLDERSFVSPNFIEWVMYIMACVGLADMAKRLRTDGQRQNALDDLSV